MKNKKGSTIVWAITLIMVLVVIVGASLSFAYMSYNQSIKNRNKTQVELIANSAIKFSFFRLILIFEIVP